MSVLIFCSFEVGGLPFKIADLLNRHGVKTYYVSIHFGARGHDSSKFHYGSQCPEWDLSLEINKYDSYNVIADKLHNIAIKKDITFCFATGAMSWILKKAGVDYHYWVYGSDLDTDCFFSFNRTHRPLILQAIMAPMLCYRRHNAVKSISTAQALWIAPYQLIALRNLPINRRLFFLPHFMDIRFASFSELLLAKETAKKEICKKTGFNKFMFSSTRHFWANKKAERSDNKGNDIIIQSFKRYIEISNDFDTMLILVSKGPDVDNTKKIIYQCNITDRVKFINEMKRDDLREFYLGAEICFGQFGTQVLSNAVIEPLACGTVCISSAVDGQNGVPYYREMPPIINSKSPIDIAYEMKTIMNDDILMRKRMKCSMDWVKQNCAEQNFVESFCELL